MRFKEIKIKIVDICRELAQKDFMLATDGNVSCRISSDKILITPKQKNKIELKVEDLVLIDINGKKIKGRNEPSGEYKLHLMIYKNRRDINAVVHTHPLFSVVLSLVGFEINKAVLPEIVLLVGEKVPLVEYGTFYTEDLVKKVEKYVLNYNAFLLKNHGLLTIAEDLDKAFLRTLKVEQLAKTIYFSKLIGKINTLSKKEVKKILKMC
ncbi:MAG: class II aldolase/adducin family protein [Candidatus Woesearchaeota archaeon]